MNQTATVLTADKQSYCFKSCFRSLIGGFNIEGPPQYHIFMFLLHATCIIQTYIIAKLVESHIVVLIVPALINLILVVSSHYFIDTEYHPRQSPKQLKHLIAVLVPQSVATASAIHYDGGVLDGIVFFFLFPREQQVEMGFTFAEPYARSHYAILFLKLMLILTHTGYLRIANILRVIYYFTPICLFLGIYGQFIQFAEYVLEQVNYFMGCSYQCSYKRTMTLFLINMSVIFIMVGISYIKSDHLALIIGGILSNLRLLKLGFNNKLEPNQLYRNSYISRKQHLLDLAQFILNLLVIILCSILAYEQYKVTYYAVIAINAIFVISFLNYNSLQFMKIINCTLQTAMISMLDYPFDDIFGIRLVQASAIYRLFNLAHTNLFELFIEELIAFIITFNTDYTMADLLIWGFLIQYGIRFLLRLKSRIKIWLIANYSMHTKKKQKLESAHTITVVQIILFPITIIILFISCILDAPYMPFLGLPLFCCASVRPYRNWFEISKNLQDSAESGIYNAFLAQSIQQLLSPLPIWNHYILRIGKYIGILQILEQCNSFAVVQFKGLESQETTSCHGVEAREIDRLVAERDWKSAITLSRIFKVNSYEENQIILTGIIESIDFVKGLKTVFMKMLCFYSQQLLTEQHINSMKKLAQHFDESDHFYPDNFSEAVHLKQKFDMTLQAPVSQPRPAKITIKPKDDDDDLMGMLESFNQEPVRKMQSESKQDTVYTILRRTLLLIYQLALDDLSFNLARLNQKTIFELFNGPSYLQQKRQLQNIEPEFSMAVTLAIRKALKLCVEYYSIEGHLNISDQEILDELNDKSVYVGVGSDSEWNTAMQNKQQLWSLGYDNGKNQLTIYRQQYSQQECQLFRFDSESIRGIEANLQMELLFITNDDEERYSIQTNELFLRNMVIEGSELPLGYAAFYSGPVVISLR